MPEGQRLAATCGGTPTVPSPAVKSSRPACVAAPEPERSSKNMAPFLGASWAISSGLADGGSRI